MGGPLIAPGRGTVGDVTTRPIARTEPEGIVDEILRRLDEGITEFRRYMATPEGRALRQRAARVAIIAAPLLFRFRFVRNSPVGRVLGLVGGAAVVIKLAEVIRDWEPRTLEDLGE